MRSDRALRRPAPPRLPGTNRRPPRHGGEFVFGAPASWGEPDTSTTTETRLLSWQRLQVTAPPGPASMARYAYTQLRLTRGAVADLRRPWERPTPPHG